MTLGTQPPVAPALWLIRHGESTWNTLGLAQGHAEVSNGTIPLSNSEKASYIRKLAGDFTVVSEVGFKDPRRSEQLPPGRWIEMAS